MSNLTTTRKLPKSWSVGGKVATDIELREATVGDYIEAEKEANPTFAPNAFNAALAAITAVRAGTFTGPFVGNHFRTMGAANWKAVREALQEAETLGEDAPAAPTANA